MGVEYNGQYVSSLPLVVVEGKGPSLFGREWLNKIVLDWQKIGTVQSVQSISLLKEHDPFLSMSQNFQAQPQGFISLGQFCMPIGLKSLTG